jgi:hypothetical protein
VNGDGSLFERAMMNNNILGSGELGFTLKREALIIFNGLRYVILGKVRARVSPTLSLPLNGSSSIFSTRLPWLLCLVCSMAAFLAPSLWNGFAIVFHDTSGYMSSALEIRLFPGRSFFYGLFLWAASFGWWSFWGPVLAQSFFALWVIHLMLRCHDLPAGPFATTMFCVGLGLSTGISWYTSQLMPDVLQSLVVLALWLLGFCWERLDRRERTGLAALALLGLLSHMSCMALAIGLAGAMLMVWVAGRRWGSTLSLCSLSPIGVVLASLVLMPMLHLVMMGKATFTPGGPAFIFGSLVQNGIAQRWLCDHCPADDIKLCGLQDRMPHTADAFLWDGKSPFMDIGGWTGDADAELSYLVKDCLKEYPGAMAWTSLRATVLQMGMVRTGDGLHEFHGATRGVFAESLPRNVHSFNAAYQQQGRITPPLFDALNRVHVPVAYLSLLGLLVSIGWGLYSKRHALAGLASFILLALIGNAFVCGALSNPHDRYQSRMMWLATLVVGMMAMHWRQLSMKKGNG